jgi:hypothetical protein
MIKRSFLIAVVAGFTGTGGLEAGSTSRLRLDTKVGIVEEGSSR